MKYRHPLALLAAFVTTAALAAGPAPEATTAANPLGGKGAQAKAASGQARQITWEELARDYEL